MRQILVTTDFSSRSERAVRRAGLLARQFGAKLILAHVVDDDQPEHRIVAAEGEATAELERMTRSVSELQGRAFNVTVVRGDAFDGIVGLAEKSATGLIVMGAHRKQLLKDVFIGTTVERVIRMRAAPVLVVNAEPSGPYLNNTLAAVDLSECSRHALQTAKALGLLAGARVTIFHVFDPMAKGMLAIAGLSADIIKRYVAEAALEASQELTQFLQTVDLGGIDYTTRVRPEEGPPARVILEAAADPVPDLVVIGTHGRSGIAKIFLGSVAQELLNGLDTDVLVVPPPARD